MDCKLTQKERDNLLKMLDSADQHLKGYIFDSLAFRYRDARYKQAQYESKEDAKLGKNPDAAKARADRDFMRFVEILNEVIGEHD